MRPRVIVIHDFLAPLFEELAKRFDFEAWILGDVRMIRKWKLQPEAMPSPCRRLPGATIGFGSRYNALWLNYTLPVALAKPKADAVICCGWDSPEDLIEDGVNGYIVPSRDPDALAAAKRRHFDSPETHDTMRPRLPMRSKPPCLPRCEFANSRLPESSRPFSRRPCPCREACCIRATA